jgi:hypothetical protein
MQQHQPPQSWRWEGETAEVTAALAGKKNPRGAAAEEEGETATATLAKAAAVGVAKAEAECPRRDMGAREKREGVEAKGHRPAWMPRRPLPSHLWHCSSSNQAPHHCLLLQQQQRQEQQRR